MKKNTIVIYSKYYSVFEPYYSKVLELICGGDSIVAVYITTNINKLLYPILYCKFSTTIGYIILQYTTVYCSKKLSMLQYVLQFISFTIVNTTACCAFINKAL